MAYFLAQEAQSAVHSVTGPMSSQMVLCSENLANVIQYTGGKDDIVTSVLLNARNLDTHAASRIDSYQAISLHMKLAEMLAAIGEYQESMQHYLAAKWHYYVRRPGSSSTWRVTTTYGRCYALFDPNDVYRMLVTARKELTRTILKQRLVSR